MLRYRVAAMVWMFMLLGAAARGGLERLGWDHLWAAAALGASYVAATTVNDVADREIDRVNHPRDRGRPLVTGEAGERELYVLHTFAVVLALAFALPLGAAGLLLVAVSLVVGWIYSLPPFLLSHRSALAPAALGVAYVLVPYLLGVVVRPEPFRSTDVLLAASLLGLFLARITLKDFRDRRGDALYGRRTLLLRVGKGATCLVSLAALCAGDALLLAFLKPAAPLFLVTQGFVLVVASRLHALWRASDPRTEQVAIGIGARAGNGLLLSVLAWLVLSGQGATLGERTGVLLTLAAAFALSLAVLLARPEQAVIGYKG
jgi:4-hydroxybenzoate polyprenyltransferase